MQVTQSHPAHASRLRRFRAALAAPLLLLAIYIGFYWKLTLTRQYTWLESPDFANQVLPWYQFEASEWHHGRFPIWDPYEWGGQSLIGQAQPGLAYPPNWILFLLPLRHGRIRMGYLNWYFVLIHYMGGLFCYLLCRDLKRSRPASLLAGAAFGITGWMGSTEWPQMLNGAVWAPLVFLFLLRVIRGERPRVNAALAGACLGIAFLSGHHQIPIYISLAAGGLWLYAFLCGAGDSPPRSRRLIFSAAALFAIFAFSTSALQTLPAYEYGKLSVRWVGANEPVGWNTPIPYSVHTEYSLYPSTLIGMILPGIARNTNAYVTLTIVVLAFLAIAAEWRDRNVRLFGAAALGGLIFALGAYVVFHGILYSLLPMVEKARSAAFAIFIFHFGIIVLTAFAADAFLAIPEFWVRRAVWAVLLASVSLFAIMLALDMTQIPKALDFDRAAAAAFYGFLLAALLAAWRYGHIAPATGIALALMLTMAQAGLETGFAWPNKEKPSEYLKKMSENSDIVEFIRKQPRFVRLEVDDQQIPYNFNDWHGIDTFNGYLASLTSNIAQIHGDDRVHMLFGANLWIGAKPLRENQQEVFTGSSGLKVYANPEAFPETWIVHEAIAPGSLEKYDLAQLRRLTFLPHPPAPKLAQCNSADWSEVTRRDPQTVWIDAQLACTGMVILSDAYYPGWAATVDGRASQIYEAYGFLRGVVVPAGRHHIELRYRPKSVYLGTLLTALGLCGAGLSLWLSGPRAVPSESVS